MKVKEVKPQVRNQVIVNHDRTSQAIQGVSTNDGDYRNEGTVQTKLQ